MSRKRLKVLIAAVAVIALGAGLTAGLGNAGPTKTKAGYRIFLLPEANRAAGLQHEQPGCPGGSKGTR